MSRFLPLFLLATQLFAFQFKYEYKHTFVLKKDEVATINIVKKEGKDKQSIYFRWTLFANDRLVLLLNYDSFPRQYILQKRYKRDRVRIYLRDDYKNIYDRSYLVLKFREFDKKSAKIEADISDKEKVLDIKFIDPKK